MPDVSDPSPASSSKAVVRPADEAPEEEEPPKKVQTNTRALLDVQPQDWPARLPVQMRVLLLRGAPVLGQAPVLVDFKAMRQEAAHRAQPGHRALEA